ncbi:Aquaporin [Erysiphe necator]|nr:Aquaporin [Erysiphe necator]
MATKTLKGLRPSFGPTIYHEEDVHMREPSRLNSDDHGCDRFRRTASLNAHPIPCANKDKYPLDQSDSASLPDLPNKPVFYETLSERRNTSDDDDYDRLGERYFQREKTNVFEGGKNYTEYGHNDPNYHRYTRRTQRFYSPPRHRSPARDVPLNGWSRIRHVLREPLSEFFGVFILVLFGDGSVAQVNLSNNTRGEWQSICWGWGLGVMLGVYTSGISGANINPAVTFTNCIFRKQSWYKFPIYAVAQIAGAFCAAGVVYGNYKSAIDIFEGGQGVRTVPGLSDTATAGIFATYPQDFVSRTTEVFNEFIAAAILMFCIYMLQDKKNMGAGKLLPLALFFVVFGIGACFGWQTGFAINMARDFGPRLFTSCVGYGSDVWTAGDYYFWIPMVVPFLGCLFGGFLYDAFLYTGESPLNEPWFGLKRLTRLNRKEEYYV